MQKGGQVAFIMNIEFDTFAHFAPSSSCLKITEKVSFKIASEASYFYILSSLKMVNFGDFLKTLSLQSNSVI